MDDRFGAVDGVVDGVRIDDVVGDVLDAGCVDVVAEQGRWWTARPRPLFAYAIVIYVWKGVVWDKVLGLGATDPLTGTVGDWAGLIMVAYFGGRSLEKASISRATGSMITVDTAPLTYMPGRRRPPVTAAG
ncbi:hypothetical protein B4Q13_16865 [Lacticaseibacillus rhamnosus]